MSDYGMLSAAGYGRLPDSWERNSAAGVNHSEPRYAVFSATMRSPTDDVRDVGLVAHVAHHKRPARELARGSVIRRPRGGAARLMRHSGVRIPEQTRWDINLSCSTSS